MKGSFTIINLIFKDTEILRVIFWGLSQNRRLLILRKQIIVEKQVFTAMKSNLQWSS